MEWIKVTDIKQLPYDKKILIKDINGFIGVGFWDCYDWVLDNMYSDEYNTCFAKIVEYCELD